MAGRPLRKAMFAEIEARGGADWLGEYIADGGTVKDLAAEFGCTRSYASRHLNAHQPYADALANARRENADALAEEALEIADAMADDALITKEKIAVNRERIDIRKWMAAANHPDRYQQNKQQTQVVLNVNALHLEALKKPRAGETARVINGDGE